MSNDVPYPLWGSKTDLSSLEAIKRHCQMLSDGQDQQDMLIAKMLNRIETLEHRLGQAISMSKALQERVNDQEGIINDLDQSRK